MTSPRRIRTFATLSLAALSLAALAPAPAHADVTYLSASRSTHGTWYYGSESPSAAGDFTATDFAPFDHTSGSGGTYAAGTATLRSTLNPTSIVSSGECYGSGNHASGFDFYGEAVTRQVITLQISQPTTISYEQPVYIIAGPGGHGLSVQYRSTGGTYQPIPAAPLLLQPGTYDVSAVASAYGGPNFGLYGRVTYSDVIHFDAVLPPPCAPDFDHSGSLTVNDIFSFLSGWFAGDPAADFNHADGISVQDIFDFLAAWFAGCP